MTSSAHHVAFAMLDAAEQRARVRKLAGAHWQDHEISTLTGLPAEQVRRVLAVPLPLTGSDDMAETPCFPVGELGGTDAVRTISGAEGEKP